MHRILSPIAATLFLALLGGCEPPVDPCTEFDPPPSHKPSSCPAKPAAANGPARPARYCYSSLAQADCYSEPQPDRPGYLGSTEAVTPAPAASTPGPVAAAPHVHASPTSPAPAS